MLSKTRFQALSAFTRKKERLESGLFFVDGWRWLKEVLALPEPPECVLAEADAPRSDVEAALLEKAREVSREYHEATAAQLARLSGSVTSSGVLALVRWRPGAFDPRVLSSDGSLIVGLDGVGDPGNAGTIVRTADWFGADAVVFGPASVEPTNAKLVRATMGSHFHLQVSDTDDLAIAVREARKTGFVAIGAALDGVELTRFTWPARAMLVVGNEATGIRPEVRNELDHRVKIPSYGRAESLNAAVAAAVLMADWRRQTG